MTDPPPQGRPSAAGRRRQQGAPGRAALARGAAPGAAVPRSAGRAPAASSRRHRDRRFLTGRQQRGRQRPLAGPAAPHCRYRRTATWSAAVPPRMRAVPPAIPPFRRQTAAVSEKGETSRMRGTRHSPPPPPRYGFSVARRQRGGAGGRHCACALGRGGRLQKTTRNWQQNRTGGRGGSQVAKATPRRTRPRPARPLGSRVPESRSCRHAQAGSTAGRRPAAPGLHFPACRGTRPCLLSDPAGTPLSFPASRLGAFPRSRRSVARPRYRTQRPTPEVQVSRWSPSSSLLQVALLGSVKGSKYSLVSERCCFSSCVNR